jgi:hypothetical protein
MWFVLAHPDLDDALNGFNKKDQSTWTDEEKRKDYNMFLLIHLHSSTQ